MKVVDTHDQTSHVRHALRGLAQVWRHGHYGHFYPLGNCLVLGQGKHG